MHTVIEAGLLARGLLRAAALAPRRRLVCVGVVPMGQNVEIPGMMLSLEEKSLLGCLYGSANDAVVSTVW